MNWCSRFFSITGFLSFYDQREYLHNFAMTAEYVWSRRQREEIHNFLVALEDALDIAITGEGVYDLAAPQEFINFTMTAVQDGLDVAEIAKFF